MRRRWGSALTAVLLLSGCLFELAELVPPGGAGGNGGGTGIGGSPVVGGQGGNAGTPPSGAGGGVEPCPSGQKSCNGQCQPITPENGCGSESCSPCVAPSNAVLGCNFDSGDCFVDRCEVGYGDCNGDSIDVLGVSGDGCEYSFGAVAAAGTPLAVPFTPVIDVDQDRNDWQGIPAYVLLQTCRDCSRDDNIPPIVAENEPPPVTDLAAYFRVAWDQDFFYVLVEAYDDHVFDAGGTIPDGRCTQQGGIGSAICEDAFSIFFDGLNNGGFANDDNRIFIGLSNKFFVPGRGQPSTSSVAMSVLPGTDRCYRMEAQFRWDYIVGSQQHIPGKFPPLGGQIYGFDMGASDWDPSLADATVTERQSQVFLTSPGENYPFSMDGIGDMVLSGGPDAGAGP